MFIFGFLVIQGFSIGSKPTYCLLMLPSILQYIISLLYNISLIFFFKNTLINYVSIIWEMSDTCCRKSLQPELQIRVPRQITYALINSLFLQRFLSLYKS